MTEHTLKERVLRRLRQWDGYWVKTWGGPYGAAGVSDIIGCVQGTYVAIELKNPKFTNPKGQLTSSQWQFIRQVEAHGGVVYVTNDDSWLMRELTERFPVKA